MLVVCIDPLGSSRTANADTVDIPSSGASQKPELTQVSVALHRLQTVQTVGNLG